MHRLNGVSTENSGVAALDWGGTWIRAAIVENGSIVARERLRRPEAIDAQYDAAATLLKQCAAAYGSTPTALGVGIAGIVQGGNVATAINLGIRDTTPVAEELADRTGLTTFLVNDSQAAAASLLDRDLGGLVAVISMGTGLGGAVLERGRLLSGQGGAGDFGHAVVVADGRPCPCGGLGCLEMYVSGRVLAERAMAIAASGSGPLADRLQASGTLHAGDLDDAGAAGDEAAVEALREAAGHLAIGLRNIVAHLDPDRVVLAGGMLSPGSTLGRLLHERWELIRPQWCGLSFEHVVDDSDATLRGAAFVAAQRRRDLSG
ncbi:MAG: glucokinase [Aeromicrobium sp.]|nr:glucokinase [Aeromicrobium sp.]